MKIVAVIYIIVMSIPVVAKSNNAIKIDERPKWVLEKNISVPKKIPSDDIDNGVYYLCIDKQVKAVENEKTVFYSHYAQLVVNQEGLDDVAQLTLSYDPDYQELILNSLVIHRGKEHINKAQTAKINILQRESNLEEQLYDGRLTASIIIEDVRVGDILEYSYTKIGANPVYKGIFNYARDVEWSSPVHFQNLRVLWGKQRPLHVKTLNSHAVVKERQLGSLKEYSVVINDSKPRYINSQVPKWYQPYGVIYFNETNSWSEIALWSSSLYENAYGNWPEISKITNQISKRFSDPKEKVTAALEYVQSNIRYLGIEMGQNSHMPSSAKDTSYRRYGDCKDKAVLFIAMLNELGIKANPALVNTKIERHIVKIPPTVNAFNHVIVKVKVGKKVYWLDPTRSYQKGKLKDIYQPDYGYALVVDRKTDALESMQNNAHISKKVIKEYFYLNKDTNKSVTFESNTQYQGYSAESQRYDLASRGATDLQKQYVDFYTSFYSGIESLIKFQSIDNPISGTISQKEKYAIKKFWTINEKDKSYEASFYANVITPYLSKPDQLKRNSPYLLSHPVDIQQTIEIKFEDDNWSFKNEKTLVDNPYFYLKYTSHYDKLSKLLILDYEYKSRADHVPANEITRYLTERSKARKILSYGLTQYFNAEQESLVENKDNTNLIIFLVFIVYLIGFIYVFMSWNFERKRQPIFSNEVFYPVSLVKFLLLSLISFGIYTAYWFYKNFLYQKKRDTRSIMPIARAILYPLWYYPLYMRLIKDSAERFEENRVLSRSFAIFYAVAFLLFDLLSSKDGLALIGFIPIFLLIPLVNYINHINESNPDAYEYNSRWKFRNTVFAILFIPLLIHTLGSDFNIIPNGKIVNGDKIMAYDIQYMQRKGVFPSEEKIQYFYSDAFFMIRDDGNGFTENTVFSYWKDNGHLQVEREQFSAIDKIKVTYSQEAGTNTVVNLIRDNGSSFLLYISDEDGLDKEFVKALKARWHKMRKPQKEKTI